MTSSLIRTLRESVCMGLCAGALLACASDGMGAETGSDAASVEGDDDGEGDRDAGEMKEDARAPDARVTDAAGAREAGLGADAHRDDAAPTDAASEADARTHAPDGGTHEGGTERDPGDAGELPDASGPGDAAVQPSAACSSGGTPATTGRATLMVGSQQREYLLHVPGTAGKEPLPLVLALHGYTMNAAEHEQVTGLSTLADQQGFAVVYPEGIGDVSGWNAGSCCAYETPLRDDIAFMANLIDQIGAELCIDLKRVYATGFSNGGMMSYRLACEMSERIAAAASVSGSIVIPLPSCHPSHPMPLMHTHGTDDPIVPYDGGSGPVWLTPAGETPPDFPSVQQEVSTFASLNACTGAPRVTFQQGDATCNTYAPCDADAEVMMCTVSGGGHTWPGGGDMGLAGIILGYQSPDLPTSQIMWDFLKSHQLP